MESPTLYDLEQSACEELSDVLAHESPETLTDSTNQTKDGKYICDLISEIADSHIPIYTRDLLNLAQSSYWLISHNPDIGYNLKRGALGMITTNIYEHLIDRLHTELQTLAERVPA